MRALVTKRPKPRKGSKNAALRLRRRVARGPRRLLRPPLRPLRLVARRVGERRPLRLLRLGGRGALAEAPAARARLERLEEGRRQPARRGRAVGRARRRRADAPLRARRRPRALLHVAARARRRRVGPLDVLRRPVRVGAGDGGELGGLHRGVRGGPRRRAVHDGAGAQRHVVELVGVVGARCAPAAAAAAAPAAATTTSITSASTSPLQAAT